MKITAAGAGLLALFLVAGCDSEPRFAMPMTANDFARTGTGPALVAYLGQRDATAEVCDARSEGPHLARFDEELRTSLVDGLVHGRINAKLWRKCAKAFLTSAPREMSASLVDDIGRGYKKLLLDSEFERSPDLQARVASMQELYLDRDNGLDGHRDVLGPMFDDLRKAIAKQRLGPIAARFGRELIVAVDLERGVFDGRSVDVAMIDQLFAAKNERGLLVFAERLPSPELRDASRRRIIRLHIAASPYPEVRAASAAVEETLIAKGVNPVSLAEHAPSRAWLEPKKIAGRGVLVRQDVHAQTVKLLGVRVDVPGASVVPDISLRGTLLADVAGISSPITLCAPPKELDPSPCIAAADVKSQQRVAYVDDKGGLRFVDSLAMKDALALAAMGAALPVPLQLANAVATLSWPLSFERPEDLVFNGPAPGVSGPPIGVLIDRRDPKRLVFHVRNLQATYIAVVEANDARVFHVASRGAQGPMGAAGSSGSPGSSGAMCQSGGNGGPGGAGGPGGRGGNGGAIDVKVACGGTPCADVAPFFAQTIVSVPGPGGSGGPGGRGGPGGSGGPAGPSTTTTNADGTTTTTPGCSAGSSGSPGPDGPSGPNGQPGRPGRVSIAVDP